MVSWLSLYLTRCFEELVEESRSGLVGLVVSRVTLGRAVVEMDYEDLEQVDIMVEAWLDSLRIAAHSVLLLAIEVVGVEVVR